MVFRVLSIQCSLVICAMSVGMIAGVRAEENSPGRAKQASSETLKSENSTTGDSVDTAVSVDTPFVKESDAQLRKRLSRMQFEVTQEEATEPAFRNQYWNNKRKGTYECIVCGLPLFSSDTKYKSGTGWPSFFAPLDEKHVGYKKDWHLFYPRLEVHCQRCNAHLGHVFDDGPQPTGKRFCMNSASLKFVPTPPPRPQVSASETDSSEDEPAGGDETAVSKAKPE